MSAPIAAGPSRGCVYGVLDTRDRIADPGAAERCRELTFAWSRWSYAGTIVEHTEPVALLAAAAATGAQHCLVQATGHLLVERLRPKGAPAPELVALLVQTLAEHEGAWVVGRPAGPGVLRESCWLVDLDRWHARGRPALVRAAVDPVLRVEAGGDGLAPFPAAAVELSRELLPELPALAAALCRPPRETDPSSLTPELAAFLASIARTLDRSRRGVFVWNLEGYDDIELVDHEPIDALHAVAAGFKPHAILRACGFHPATRVVLMDYSAEALAFRRMLHEHWDGRDLPGFLWPRLTAGSGRAHYWLRSTVDDGPPAREELERLWASELEDWGGVAAFADCWDRIRRLPHRFVEVDLLRSPEQAIPTPVDGPSVTWWSNAFSSVHAIWHLDHHQRQQAFAAWIAVLAARCPRTWLLGADANNVPVSGVRVVDHAARLAAWTGGMHRPLRSGDHDFRF